MRKTTLALAILALLASCGGRNNTHSHVTEAKLKIDTVQNTKHDEATDMYKPKCCGAMPDKSIEYKVASLTKIDTIQLPVMAFESEYEQESCEIFSYMNICHQSESNRECPFVYTEYLNVGDDNMEDGISVPDKMDFILTVSDMFMMDTKPNGREYKIEIMTQFVLGQTFNCMNPINPRLSPAYLIFNETIDHEKLFQLGAIRVKEFPLKKEANEYAKQWSIPECSYCLNQILTLVKIQEKSWSKPYYMYSVFPICESWHR